MCEPEMIQSVPMYNYVYFEEFSTANDRNLFISGPILKIFSTFSSLLKKPHHGIGLVCCILFFSECLLH